jgi:hypothetical protein
LSEEFAKSGVRGMATSCASEAGATEKISRQASMLGVSRVIRGMETGMLIVIFKGEKLGEFIDRRSFRSSRGKA